MARYVEQADGSVSRASSAVRPTQRLNAWNMSDGTVQVHAVGCSHKAGSGRNAKAYRQDQVEFGQTEWTSQYAFAHDYWDNGILEEHEAENGVGSFDVFIEMDFKPCVKLPRYAATDPISSKNVRSTSEGSNAKRAEARKILYTEMMRALDNSPSRTQDPELLALMEAQAARVAHMFGLDR